jgi:DNA polymerase
MKPTGEGKRSILFVAEAPGEQEDEEGVQLVGKSGQFLRSTLQDLGVELEDCIKTNAVICRPPGNEIKNLYIESCRPNLVRTIREQKPSVIILLGGSAVKGLIPTEREASVGSVSRWVGWKIPSAEYGAWICPTYHPSYLLRMNDPVLNRLFRNHLKQAVKLEGVQFRGETLEELKSQVEIIESPRLGRLRLKDLAKKKGILAFDYEANRIKPDHPRAELVAVSFCLEGEDTFSILLHDSHMAPLSRVLRNDRFLTIASNIKNEERWTRSKLGHGIPNWYWDTMLTAHFLDNRGGITSLKFQSFIHLGIADYDSVVSHYFERMDSEGFNRIRDCPVGVLLEYNALDSLLEFKVYQRQRKEMGL